MSETARTFSSRVLGAVRGIPEGRVATYGQVATWLGSPRAARAVGMALAGLKYRPGERVDDVPWHRVINSAGKISAPADLHRFRLQRALLEAEGVVFDASGRVDLAVFRYLPDTIELT